jgi:hypothetical protein
MTSRPVGLKIPPISDLPASRPSAMGLYSAMTAGALCGLVISRLRQSLGLHRLQPTQQVGNA